MKAIIKRTGEVIEVNPVCPEQWAEITSDAIGRRVFERNALILDEPTDWASFRREAAKDFVCAMLQDTRISYSQSYEWFCDQAIELADKLVKQLQESER